MVVFLYNEFGVLVNASTISRALAAAGRTKKVIRQVARQRNVDLRNFYLHNLSAFQPYHLVFINKSGCDKRIGFRRTGWSPLGVTPIQVAKFRRDRRYKILPTYAQDGVFFHEFSGDQLIALCIKTLSSSSFSTADGGLNPNLFL